MSAAVRRMAIWNTLCSHRQVKMKELAAAHGVTIRTIRFDIEQLSLTHPIETVRGRYDGCVKVAEWYEATSNPLNEMQMSFLIGLLASAEGTDAIMLCSIITTLTTL